MYTIYDNIIQKNQFSTTTNNVKVIQSSYICDPQWENGH